ncbi:MAG: DUF4177 domain-containing protein [Pseudomonadota bacterium]
MQRYEYKVVPAPQKGTKAKGVKTAEGRFATSVEMLLNQMGQDGWEYQRAELLPSEERSGLTGSTTNWRNVLVFRRTIDTGPAPVTDPDEPPQDVALAQPVPGPDHVIAPEPIAQDANDPPLTSPVSEDDPQPSDEDPERLKKPEV